MPHVRGHYRRGPWFRSHWVRPHDRKPQGLNALLAIAAVIVVLAFLILVIF